MSSNQAIAIDIIISGENTSFFLDGLKEKSMFRETL